MKMTRPLRTVRDEKSIDTEYVRDKLSIFNGIVSQTYRRCKVQLEDTLLWFFCSNIKTWIFRLPSIHPFFCWQGTSGRHFVIQINSTVMK